MQHRPLENLSVRLPEELTSAFLAHHADRLNWSAPVGEEIHPIDGLYPAQYSPALALDLQHQAISKATFIIPSLISAIVGTLLNRRV